MSPEILNRLRDHQVQPAQRLLEILQHNRTAADFSDTGTGKTYVAAAVAKSLALPTLVVVPKIAINQWHRAAEHFDDSISVINYDMLRTGRTPYGRWDNNPPPGFIHEERYVCQCCQQKVDLENYSPCYTHPQGVHCLVIKKTPWKYGKFHFHPGVSLIVFDEGHRCGSLDSLNAGLMIAARRDVPKGLVLTATAACSPLQMRALGYFLDLHTLNYDVLARPPVRQKKNFYSWVARYGVRREPMRGLQWHVGAEQQRVIMAEIRKEIIPARGVRVCVDDIPGFPEREIISELYDFDEVDKINGLYDEMADALNRLERTQVGDVCPDHPLTRILRARQKIELLKVPIGVELARDYVAKGYSVGLFVNFRQTLDALRERLGLKCIIDGSPAGQRNRQWSIDVFQSDVERVIGVNNEAGGLALSLPDLHGKHPRVGIVFPSEKAKTMRQIFGRFHRDGSKSKCFYRVILAARTYETSLHRNLRNKLNNLDALNDADLMPDNLVLTKSSFPSTNYLTTQSTHDSLVL